MKKEVKKPIKKITKKIVKTTSKPVAKKLVKKTIKAKVIVKPQIVNARIKLYKTDFDFLKDTAKYNKKTLADIINAIIIITISAKQIKEYKK